VVAAQDPRREAVPVPATTDIANFVNSKSPDSKRQVFQLAANITYRVNALIILRAGDALSGAVPSGTPRMVGPATDPDPTTKLVNGAALESLIGLRGDNAITWLDMSGADYKGQQGTGSAISAGSGNDNTLIQFNRIHDNGRPASQTLAVTSSTTRSTTTPPNRSPWLYRLWGEGDI
jgi:hypothetical protein